MALFKLLQSGYAGLDSSDLVQIPEKETSLMQAVITQSIFLVDTSNYYDKGVTQLYGQMAVENRAFADFKFRETLILKAFQLFGQEDFRSWFISQSSSPCYSYLHERFLKETLLYVFEGKPRAMSHNSYLRLLHVGANNPAFAMEDRNALDVELKKILLNVPSGLTLDLLKRWTRRVEGLQDLLATLNVIFGRRGMSAG